MRKLLVLLPMLLLGSASVWAQDDAKAATITPTSLPGEEELSAQERAERDFLMPVRRKRAAALEAVEEKARQAQAATEAAVKATHLAAQVAAEKAVAPEPVIVPVEERKGTAKRKTGRR